MTDRIMLADMRTVGLKNDLVIVHDKYRNINIRIIKPSVRLTGDTLKFNNDRVLKMIDIGYRDACRE